MTNPDTARLGFRGILTAGQNVNFRLVFAFRLSSLFFSMLSALEGENRGWTIFAFSMFSALGSRRHFVCMTMPHPGYIVTLSG
jgi:hypothetical protein